MALTGAHASAKAADVATLLLLNKRQITNPPRRSMYVLPPPNLSAVSPLLLV